MAFRASPDIGVERVKMCAGHSKCYMGRPPLSTCGIAASMFVALSIAIALILFSIPEPFKTSPKALIGFSAL